MPTTLILVTIATLTAVGYILGRGRAVEVAEGRLARLHSVPSYHGAFVALWAGLPALVLLVVWILAEGPAVMALVLARLPESLVAVDEQTLSLLRSDILNLAHGVTNGRTPDPLISDAADLYNQLHGLAEGCLVVLGAVAGVIGLKHARGQIAKDLRARNLVERALNVALVLCSLVAILTTVGIVLSLLFEAIQFFSMRRRRWISCSRSATAPPPKPARCFPASR